MYGCCFCVYNESLKIQRGNKGVETQNKFKLVPFKNGSLIIIRTIRSQKLIDVAAF